VKQNYEKSQIISKRYDFFFTIVDVPEKKGLLYHEANVALIQENRIVEFCFAIPNLRYFLF